VNPAFAPPGRFEEYELVQFLGHGEMGHVYLAYDTLLARYVAVKFVATSQPSEAARQRFLTEARAAARLAHPNVVAVHRVGELDGRPYLVSEFVRGQTLDRLEKPIPWQRALAIAIDLARGLAGAHREGVLHRDVKPGNAILAEDGTAKLFDFGLAKLVEPGESRVAPRSTSRAATKPERFVAPTDRAHAERAKLREVSAEIEGAGETPSEPTPDTPEDMDLVARATAITRDPDEPAPSGDAGEPAREKESTSAPAPTDFDPSLTPARQRTPSSPDEGSGIAQAAASLDARGALTQLGAVVGTPDYMSPEVWRGEPGGRASDVYSLGATLYELCVGTPPYGVTPLHALRQVIETTDARPLIDAAPKVDARFAAIVDRCLRRAPEERYASGEELREALEQLQRATSANDIPEGNPYRGLRVYEPEHSALFFGRGAEIGVLVDRLRSEPYVVVTGESGVGKSSVCRAGVLPAIAAGALEGGRTWQTIAVSPGRHPLAALAAALAPAVHLDERALAKQIADDPASVIALLRRSLGEAAGMVLFVDPLEELCTIAVENEVAAADTFLARLADSVPGVRLFATARVDFLTKLARLQGLGEQLSRSLYILRPLSAERLHEVIVGPANATGVRFESEHLVDTLVLTTATASGGLPLLQFALAELWEARDLETGLITERALESIGGVAGALSRHADGVLRLLLPEQRRAARNILTKLVTVEGTRARLPEDELVQGDPQARGALEGLVRGRILVVEEGDETEGSVYELAHEVLLRDWATLREFLHEDSDRRAVLGRLRVSATEWERLDHSRDVLWQQPQIAEYARLGEGVTKELGDRERSFLESSRRALLRRRIFRIAAALSLPVLLFVVYIAFVLQARMALDERVGHHLERARSAFDNARASNEHLVTLQRASFAKFDAREREAGEALWTRASEEEARVESGFASAARELEAALALDPQRTEVRALFGDIILERALLADRTHRARERDELLLRLSLYDEDGSRRVRWSMPATLTLLVSSQARLTLARYLVDPRGRLSLGTPRHLDARTTAAPIPLEPASYRLDAREPGRAPVSYPLLVARGESLTLAIDLPASASIPKGFVYVPPGRFLFGSAAEDGLRRGFYDTVPLHEVTTDGYLVGQSEVTIAEWLEFLAALPPEERERRRPSVPRSLSQNGAALLLEQAEGRWRFEYQPAQFRYEAREGAPLRYRFRPKRAEQQWPRFPVTGIDTSDALAYLSWLRRSGRVPGARFCTEYEWERAARGADGREFPHGAELLADDANFDETYAKDPRGMGLDEVGSHPPSRSPFGVDDMTGNAFEWVVSSLQQGQYVGRGGSYFYERNTNRLTNRQLPTATLRDATLGLRVCASFPPS
jgi:serine/threonine protein kinase/formylglycine-generating enzyme required for sulfatase activity